MTKPLDDNVNVNVTVIETMRWNPKYIVMQAGRATKSWAPSEFLLSGAPKQNAPERYFRFLKSAVSSFDPRSYETFH